MPKFFQLIVLLLIAPEMLAQGESLDFSEVKLVDFDRPTYPSAALQRKAESL